MTHPSSSRFLLSHGFIGLFSLPKFDTIHLHSIELTVINSNLAVTLLRKAVRRTDSLLFATEGRIGGLGAEPRFRARNLAVPLRRGWSREAVVRVMYRVAIC